jgi:uncharacterized protein (TIGR02611 family)
MHEQAQREPEMVRRLRARRADHLQHGRLYRAAFVVVGFLTLGAGLALLVLPGPAFVVIPIGLAILSLEFAWAERLLEKALMQAEQARRKAAEASPLQRLLSAIGAVLAIGACIAAAILWDIPVLPV